MSMTDPRTYPPGQWGLFAREWRRTLRSENKSANTIRIYLTAVRAFDEWAHRQEPVVQPPDTAPVHVREFIADMIEATSPANAHTHYRALRTFFKWLEGEGEIARTPMDRTKAPFVPEKPVPVIADADVKASEVRCKMLADIHLKCRGLKREHPVPLSTRQRACRCGVGVGSSLLPAIRERHYAPASVRVTCLSTSTISSTRLMGSRTMLFALDGPSGGGKTTVATHIVKELESTGIKSTTIKSPTDTRLGRFFRVAPDFLDGICLAHIAVADRYMSLVGVQREIESHGDVVIADRFVLSSLVFQALDGVPMAETWHINRHFPRPAMTYVLTASKEQLLDRTRRRGHLDRFERMQQGISSESTKYDEAVAFVKSRGLRTRKVVTDKASPRETAKDIADDITASLEGRR